MADVATKFCNQCGKKISVSAKFCPFCGAAQEEFSNGSAESSQVVTSDQVQEQVEQLQPIQQAQQVVQPQSVEQPRQQNVQSASQYQQQSQAQQTFNNSNSFQQGPTTGQAATEGNIITKTVAATQDAFNKIVTIDGRTSLADFWYAMLGFFVIGLGILVIMALVPIVGLLLDIAFMIPATTIWIRRLHDVNKAGTYYLFILIPLVGSILLLIWSLDHGTRGTNDYGPEPVEVTKG